MWIIETFSTSPAFSFRSETSDSVWYVSEASSEDCCTITVLTSSEMNRYVAAPEPVRFEVKDVLVEPATLNEAASPEVRQHFEQPPGRME